MSYVRDLAMHRLHKSGYKNVEIEIDEKIVRIRGMWEGALEIEHLEPPEFFELVMGRKPIAP